jgi:hypothetical protein
MTQRVDVVEALRISSEALDAAKNNPQEAIAILVHALAGTLVTILRPESIDELIRGNGAEFGSAVAEALPSMASLLNTIVNEPLATMKAEGRA